MVVVFVVLVVCGGGVVMRMVLHSPCALRVHGVMCVHVVTSVMLWCVDMYA